MQPTVYILASGRNGTLYVGVTSTLVARIHQHRIGALGGFTRRYRVHRLVYYEGHASMHDAIRREKQIKEWRRAWKTALIETRNPYWLDLWPTLTMNDAGPGFRRGDDGGQTTLQAPHSKLDALHTLTSDV